MTGSRTMLLIALACFLIYLSDVVAGALYKAAFLSDIAAVLTLLASCVSFTIAILELEQRDAEELEAPSESQPLEKNR